MSDPRSPEEWEAAEHITNLKAGLNVAGVCPAHGQLTMALIWMIRRIDLAGKRGELAEHRADMVEAGGGWKEILLAMIRSSPLGGVAGAVCFGLWVYAKAKGIL